MAEKDNDIEELKKKYEVYRKKYSLPSFTEMNDEFTIEDIAEHSYTELLLRRIRYFMAERVLSTLRLIEPIMNPSNAPIFIHTIAKNLNQNAYSILEALYKEGCDIEIKSWELGLSSNDEQKEVEFIKHVLEKWKKMKPRIAEMNKYISDAWKKSESAGDKSYLG